MRIRFDRSSEQSLTDQAREQIVSALHAGLLRRGDRLPSLRSVAAQSRLNVKTVLKVYARLQGEGLVTLRRGSGAYVSGQDTGGFEPSQAVTLCRMLRRHLNEAVGMNVTPSGYAALVQRLVGRRLLSGRSVAVLECNEEQVRLYAREITVRIGVKACPLLLDDARTRAATRLLSQASILAITDFHYKEGVEIARRLRKPMVQLRLRRDFLPAVMDAARRGRLAMIVWEASFTPAFKRALGVLGLQREHLERISVVAGSDASTARRAMARADFIYISPLCGREVRALAPPEARLLTFVHHLAGESIEALEAWLLLSGQAADSDGAPSR